MIPTALTIAGSDSGGGAGIQADLKTFVALGVYGTSAITAVTAQNTVGVQGIHDIPAENIILQIDSVLTDIGAQAIKTGMLSNVATIAAVADTLQRYEGIPLVVDPVMVAKSGDALLASDAAAVLVERLIPLATVVTPNMDEAQVLTGLAVTDVESMKAAAQQIHAMGADAVVVKGGHLDGAAIDVLYDGGRDSFELFEAERINSENTHGTGCTFASAVTAELAKSVSVKQAVSTAKCYLHDAIRHAMPTGKGHGPVNHVHALYEAAERHDVLNALATAVRRLEETPEAGLLVPEVQSNLAMGIPGAKTPADVAAFPGRLVRFHRNIRIVAGPEFGASSHIAKIVLTAMRHDPNKRAVMNILYTKEILTACRSLDLFVASFNRKMEPHDVKEREGSSLEWGTEQVIREHQTVPDIVYDVGDEGKEPMIRIIAADPDNVVDIALQIVDRLK